MQQVVVNGVRQAALVETTNLQPVENWVVVKVHAAPMCPNIKPSSLGRQTP
jgi:hypothetical protein